VTRLWPSTDRPLRLAVSALAGYGASRRDAPKTKVYRIMQLPLWQIVVLAVVQGLTEFLPVSSDGHLAVVAALLIPHGSRASLEVPDLVIVLHGGTLMSILVFYWRRIWELLKSDRRTIGLLCVATIPAVLVGLPVELYAEKWLTNPVLAGFFLVITGIILLIAERGTRGTAQYSEMRFGQAFLIGMAQAAAILPGLSRSGSTITTALRMKFHPRAAATFSFLMAIPVIAGACVLKLATIIHAGGLKTPVGHLAIGVVVSFSVGLLALWWLVQWLERGRFSLFAWWCIPVGVAVVIWQLSNSSPVFP
jgi:undecaprenyl-diphosphatase